MNNIEKTKEKYQVINKCKNEIIIIESKKKNHQPQPQPQRKISIKSPSEIEINIESLSKSSSVKVKRRSRIKKMIKEVFVDKYEKVFHLKGMPIEERTFKGLFIMLVFLLNILLIVIEIWDICTLLYEKKDINDVYEIINLIIVGGFLVLTNVLVGLHVYIDKFWLLFNGYMGLCLLFISFYSIFKNGFFDKNSISNVSLLFVLLYFYDNSYYLIWIIIIVIVIVFSLFWEIFYWINTGRIKIIKNGEEIKIIDSLLLSYLSIFLPISTFVIIVFMNKKIKKKRLDKLLGVARSLVRLDLNNSEDIKQLFLKNKEYCTKYENVLQLLSTTLKIFYRYLPAQFKDSDDIEKVLIEEENFHKNVKEYIIFYIRIIDITTYELENINKMFVQFTDLIWKIMKKYGGTIQQVKGNGTIICTMNLNTPVKACQASLKIIDTIKNPKYIFSVRISLIKGKTCIGNIGSNNHRNYTFVGNLEDVCETFDRVNRDLNCGVVVIGKIAKGSKSFMFEFRLVELIEMLNCKNERLCVFEVYQLIKEVQKDKNWRITSKKYLTVNKITSDYHKLWIYVKNKEWKKASDLISTSTQFTNYVEGDLIFLNLKRKVQQMKLWRKM